MLCKYLYKISVRLSPRLRSNSYTFSSLVFSILRYPSLYELMCWVFFGHDENTGILLLQMESQSMLSLRGPVMVSSPQHRSLRSGTQQHGATYIEHDALAKAFSTITPVIVFLFVHFHATAIVSRRGGRRDMVADGCSFWCSLFIS